MKRAALSDLPPILLNREGKNHLGFVSDGWNLYASSMPQHSMPFTCRVVNGWDLRSQ